jgi:hypothetical protein
MTQANKAGQRHEAKGGPDSRDRPMPKIQLAWLIGGVRVVSFVEFIEIAIGKKEFSIVWAIAGGGLPNYTVVRPLSRLLTNCSVQ